MVTPASASADQYAFGQCMKCENPFQSLDKTLTCVCFRWIRSDEHVHTRSLHTVKGMKSLPAVGEWFSVEQLSIIRGCVGVVLANYEVQPFTEAFYWPQQRFYIDRFNWDRGMHTEPSFATNVDNTLHLFTLLVAPFHIWNVSISSGLKILCKSAYNILKTHLTKQRHTHLQSNL